MSRDRGQLPQPVDCSNAEPMVWEVDTIALERPIKQLSDMHYLVAFGIDDLEPGGDFLFWYWFTQALKQRLLRDQYLPALRYRQPPKPKGKRKLPPPELYAGWQWAAGDDDPLLVWAAERMPAACAAGIQPVGAKAGAAAKTQPAFAPHSLLRHAAEVLLDQPVRQTKWPATALRRLDHTLLAPCVASEAANARWTPVGPWPAAAQEKQRQWLAWRARILGGEQAAAFRLAGSRGARRRRDRRAGHRSDRPWAGRRRQRPGGQLAPAICRHRRRRPVAPATAGGLLVRLQVRARRPSGPLGCRL